jgi:hypothetical protein
MEWLKRNLGFAIGSIVALALMGLGGYYFYSKWQLNNEVWDKLSADYAELTRLGGEKPHPGSRDVDNIKTAKEQQQQLKGFIQKSRQYFQKITPIPDLPKVTDQEFSAALSRTIDKMQRDATNASVNLPASYNFSFAAEKSKVSFASAGLAPLSVQLGEVKAICDVLFDAKINTLDNLRRERVSPDDSTGPQTDYLLEKSITNELAVLTPYELSFRCFSPELATVLAGFGKSPDGLIVKSINVELAPEVAVTTETPAPVTPVQTYVQQPTPPPTTSRRGSESDAFAARYGLSRGGKNPAPAPQPPPQQVYVPGAAPAAASKGGLTTVLDERQLRVTLMVAVVKLADKK